MVSPSEWGPSAWDLLHGLAERVGNHSNHLLMKDEQNELRLVLRHLWALLPCLKCQKHYKEWYNNNNPDKFIQGPFGSELQDSLRKWFYDLHEKVNQSNSIVSNLTLEEVSQRYANVPLRERASSLKAFYQRGLDSRTLKAEDWKVAWKHLDLLLRFL